MTNPTPLPALPDPDGWAGMDFYLRPATMRLKREDIPPENARYTAKQLRTYAESAIAALGSSMPSGGLVTVQWATEWFGPDADEAYLARAVAALTPMKQGVEPVQADPLSELARAPVRLEDSIVHDWRQSDKLGGEVCAKCAAVKGTRRGNLPCIDDGQQPAPVQGGLTEAQAALIELGTEMVNITTTVRGIEEWPAIPAMWLDCMRERDEARAALSANAGSQQSEPLSFRQIAEITPGLGHVRSDHLIDIVRAVEQFHGIGPLATPKEASQPTYPLPDDLYPDSKDWMSADYAGRVEWLHVMYESKKKELGQPTIDIGKTISGIPTRQGWCERCGCGNDRAGFAHLDACPPNGRPTAAGAVPTDEQIMDLWEDFKLPPGNCFERIAFARGVLALAAPADGKGAAS